MDYAEVDAIYIHHRCDLERAHHHGHQVGAHRHRVGERHCNTPTLTRAAGNFGTVRHSDESVVDDQSDTESGLRFWFVPARKHPPTVGGLHLGGGDDPVVAIAIGERRSVEAAQKIVDHAREGDVDHMFSDAQCCASGEREPLGRGVESGGDRRAINRGGFHLEIDGIQHQCLVLLGDLDRDGDMATERAGGQIGPQLHLVVHRLCVTWEAVGVCCGAHIDERRSRIDRRLAWRG